LTNGHASKANIVKNTIKLLETNKTPGTSNNVNTASPSRTKRSSSIDNVLNENSNDKYLYEILQNIYDQNKNDIKQRSPSPSIANHHYSNYNYSHHPSNINQKQYSNDENNFKYLTPPNSGNDIDSTKNTSRSKSLNRDYSYLDQNYSKRKLTQPANSSRHYNNGSSSSNNKIANYYHDDQSSCSSFTSTTPHVPKPPPGNPQRVSSQQGR
jgi:hypothetical protein